MNKYPELIKALKNDELIIFVGAGVSYDLQNINNEEIGGWNNLVNKIITHLKNKKYDVNHLLGLVGKCEAIKILDLIESDKKLPKTEILDFVKDFFDLHKDNDYSLHKSIFKLSKKIITTNYDTAFETAISELRKNAAYKGKNYELTKHKDPNFPLLFKLHGCYENADTMVLFPSGYKNLYNNPNKDAEHSLLVLRNIILNRTVLFVGCGMGDFQINNIFSEIKRIQGQYNQTHYIITKNQPDSSLNFLTPIIVKDYKETIDIINALISEKEKFVNKKSPELLLLENQLVETAQKLSEYEIQIGTISNEVERKDELLKREALKYFQRGLEFQYDKEYNKAENEYKISIELDPANEVTLYHYSYIQGEISKNKPNDKAIELLYKSIEKLKKSIEIRPDYYEAYNSWGNKLGNIAVLKIKEDVDSIFYQAFEKFNEAIKIKPDYYLAYCNWGIYLTNMANKKLGEDSKSLYDEAIEKLKKSIELYPHYFQSYLSWGVALGKIAGLKLDNNSLSLYIEAFEKLQKSIDLNPESSHSYNIFGIYLIEFSRVDEKEKIENHYLNALDKFSKATELSPKNHKFINNLGLCLCNLADIKISEDANNMYNQAIENYNKAIGIKPDYEETYYNLGTLYAKQARLKSKEEAEILYELSIEQHIKAIELGARLYNLACVYALRKYKNEALSYLDKSFQNNENDVNFVLNDNDWSEYIDDEDFIALIKKYENNS